MLRTSIKVAVAMAGVGVVLAGCAPVKVGSAAIVGNQRISIATLDSEATALAAAAKQYPGQVSLTQSAVTKDTLTWLVRFQVRDELSRREGITVTPAQRQAALATILEEAQAQAAQSGVTNVTLKLLMTANGIAPDTEMQNALGDYQAIQLLFVEHDNGGKIPTATKAIDATTAKFTRAECLASKSLQIKINPQFGRLNYTQQAVVATADTLSRPSGAAASAGSTTGLTPSC